MLPRRIRISGNVQPRGAAISGRRPESAPQTFRASGNVPLSYVHICAERLQSGDGRILTFPLCYRGYVNTYAERTRNNAGGSAIYWGHRWFGARGFEADAENWVLDPFVAEQILLPLRLRSATAYVWTHVMICVEANFPPVSARVRSAHVWTYLEVHRHWPSGRFPNRAQIQYFNFRTLD